MFLFSLWWVVWIELHVGSNLSSEFWSHVYIVSSWVSIKYKAILIHKCFAFGLLLVSFLNPWMLLESLTPPFWNFMIKALDRVHHPLCSMLSGPGPFNLQTYMGHVLKLFRWCTSFFVCYILSVLSLGFLSSPWQSFCSVSVIIIYFLFTVYLFLFLSPIF